MCVPPKWLENDFVLYICFVSTVWKHHWIIIPFGRVLQVLNVVSHFVAMFFFPHCAIVIGFSDQTKLGANTDCPGVHANDHCPSIFVNFRSSYWYPKVFFFLIYVCQRIQGFIWSLQIWNRLHLKSVDYKRALDVFVFGTFLKPETEILKKFLFMVTHFCTSSYLVLLESVSFIPTTYAGFFHVSFFKKKGKNTIYSV